MEILQMTVTILKVKRLLVPLLERQRMQTMYFNNHRFNRLYFIYHFSIFFFNRSLEKLHCLKKKTFSYMSFFLAPRLFLVGWGRWSGNWAR